MKQILLVLTILNLMGCENHLPSQKVSLPGKPSLPTLTVTDFSQDKTLSDEQILALAQLKMDNPLNAKLPKILGNHHGVPVLFKYYCVESCPNLTVKFIYYQLSPKQDCQKIGGVEKSLLVPFGIAAATQKFCFPKIITDNWVTYQHSYDNFAEVKAK